MTTEKTNLMRSSAPFPLEPVKVKEERRVVKGEPHLELENLRSSTLQPLFTLGRRSRGKALEI